MAPSGKRGRKKPKAAGVASPGKCSAASNHPSTASPALFEKHSGISLRTSTVLPLSGNSLLSTPIKVLRDQRKRKRKEDPQREERELRALVNCVMSAAEGVDEEPLCCLRDLLDHGISPNTGIGQPELLKHHGGSALHIACNLDCPEAVKLLLDYGATLLAKFEEITAAEMAFSSHQCAAIVLEHIGKLEECYREQLKLTDHFST